MVAACPFPYPRGTPARIYRLARALGERGHDVHVVTYHLGNHVDGADLTIHRIARIPSYRRLEPGPTYQKLLLIDTLLTLRLRRLLRERSFDVVHAHHFEGLLAALTARRRSRLPVIFEAHALLGGELPYYRLGLPRALKSWVGRSLDRRLPARADAIIAVSERIRDRLVTECGIDAERISVVPGGVELELFAPEGASPACDPTIRRLIYTGNLAPYQGIEVMLEAFARVREKVGETRLVLATESPFAPYEALARRLGVRDHIDLVPGEVSGLRDHLAGAEVALNPRVECVGYPQKVLNYMAAGKAIVSFWGSAADLTGRDVARIVDGADPGAFAEAVLELLEDADLRQRLGANARTFVRRERSWEGTAERTERVYRELLARGAPAAPAVR
jgi:glycosyltransferase involved in cell wall biosynthesis